MRQSGIMVDAHNYGKYKQPPCLKTDTPHLDVLFYGAEIAISPGENRSARKIDVENVPPAYVQASAWQALTFLSGNRRGDRRRGVQLRMLSRAGIQFSNEEEKRSPAYVPQPRDYSESIRERAGAAREDSGSVKLLSRSRGFEAVNDYAT